MKWKVSGFPFKDYGNDKIRRGSRMFSKRTDWPLASNLLTQRLLEKRNAGHVHVIDMTQSNPTLCAFSYCQPRLLESLRHPKNISYEPDAHGLLEAREAVCAYYRRKGIKAEVSQVFLTSSTSEAYAYLFRLLADNGDEFLSPEPSYPLFDYLAGLNDVRLKKYSLFYDQERWTPDLSFFEKEQSGQSKALILVNPNNPTGNYVRQAERVAINAVCARNKWAVISDEVFLDFVLNDQAVPPRSLAGNEDVLTFTLSGISKILGLPQMKLSWILVSGPRDVTREAIRRLEIIADTYLSPSTPVQRALSTWFSDFKEVTIEIKDRVRNNYEYLNRQFENSRTVKVLRADGGWYSVLQVHSKCDDESAALHLLEKENVFVHPGYFFDFAKENYLVISLLSPTAEFQEGVRRITSGLNSV